MFLRIPTPRAQEEPPSPEAANLARDFSDPLTTIPQLTLATLGYGDVVPVSEPARGLAIVE